VREIQRPLNDNMTFIKIHSGQGFNGHRSSPERVNSFARKRRRKGTEARGLRVGKAKY